MDLWQQHIIPSPNICPKEYCFFWTEEGDYFAPDLYGDLQEALNNTKEITRSGCRCTFGKCVRNKDANGLKDWYEPCEPELEKAELPWFYFMSLDRLNRKKQRIYKKYFR
jgi:hypothetical protein